MTTEPVDPWDIDEYIQSLHHHYAYLDGKAKNAAESGNNELYDRYIGKMAFIMDKIIGLLKTRALWKEAGLLSFTPHPEFDAIDKVEDPKLKERLRKKKQRLETKLKIVSARRHLSNIQNEIDMELEEIEDYKSGGLGGSDNF